MLTIRAIKPSDENAIITLWEHCGLVRPQNDPRKDILRKLKVRPDLFRIGLLEGEIIATVMVGYEGHRGWINYLAVSPGHQRKGFGRRMMEEAERLLRAEGCPKVNLLVRTTNSSVVAFYRTLGYAIDEAISLGKRLEYDERERNS